MKYVVTGGSGFIGSYIVKQLVADNNEVIVLDDFSRGKMENLGGVVDKIVIKYLIMFLSVTVTGPPFFICDLNLGITEPEEPITFPKRTIEKTLLSPIIFISLAKD